MNVPTIIIGLIVFGLFAAIIIKAIYNRHNNKGGGCSGSCASCGGCSACSPTATPKK